MVRKKGEEEKSLKETLAEFSERLDRESPVVQTIWSVEEVTPGYNTGGYYDQDIPEYFERVSPFFDTKEEANDWADKHEADSGKYLAIRKHVAREHRVINWVSVRIK